MKFQISGIMRGIIAYVLQEAPQAKTLPVKLLRNGEPVEVELSLE